MKSRTLIAGAILVVVVGIAAGIALRTALDRPEAPSRVAANVKTFSLIDQAGRPVTESTYHGRWMLVFFGFTHCPDVCPAAMILAGQLLEALGPLAENLQVAFITVDPERDTPSALKDYLANFDSRIVGLTGTAEQIAAATRTFGVAYAQRRLDGQEGYTMDHSTAFYLVDGSGRGRRAFAVDRGADELIDEVRAALSASPPSTGELK